MSTPDPDIDAFRSRYRAEEVSAAMSVQFEQIHPSEIPGRCVNWLKHKIIPWLDQARDTLHYTRSWDHAVVHFSKSWTWTDRASHVVARWLKALGIEVSGNPVFGHWRVQ